MKDLELMARMFSKGAHNGVGQKRKYSGVDYFKHPEDVVKLLKSLVDDVTPEMIAAAYLHDVREDTEVTEEDLVKAGFPPLVVYYVDCLTNPSKKTPELSRKERKKIDREHLSKVPNKVKAIKLVDIFHNLTSMISDYGLENGPKKDFLDLYMNENLQLIEVLKEGSDNMYLYVTFVINSYFNNDYSGIHE